MTSSGEKKISERYYLKALSLNSNLLTAQGDLAMLFAETGRIDEAVDLARRMVEINSNNAEAHFSLSYIYRYGGMLNQAVEELEKAMAINPTNYDAKKLEMFPVDRICSDSTTDFDLFLIVDDHVEEADSGGPGQ